MTRCPSSPFLASLLFFAACSTLSAAPQSEPKSQASGASEATKGDQSSGADAEKSDKDKDTEKSEEPKLAITEHTVTVGGKTLKYHATTGYMVLKEEEGKQIGRASCRERV